MKKLLFLIFSSCLIVGHSSFAEVICKTYKGSENKILPNQFIDLIREFSADLKVETASQDQAYKYPGTQYIRAWVEFKTQLPEELKSSRKDFIAQKTKTDGRPPAQNPKWQIKAYSGTGEELSIEDFLTNTNSKKLASADQKQKSYFQ